jgi:RHS repeat-associated protein
MGCSKTVARTSVSKPSREVKNGAVVIYYQYNRNEHISFPKNPQNNVSYYYGKANETPTRRGRLWFVKDASGGSEYFYDTMGNKNKEIRTLQITPTDIQTYVSEFEYDSWSRIQKMVYPDGEVVDYSYNRAGNLLKMTGVKENHSYNYIEQLGYDIYEKRKYLKYGNGTETSYNYEPELLRLQNMNVKSGARTIMNNVYQYDPVGNVLGIVNSAPVVPGTLGGTSKHRFEYDEFYRLKNATATYKGEFTDASYTLNMKYNNMHNIIKKDLIHSVNGEQKGYVLDYKYDNAVHPNAPSTITEGAKIQDYTYDGNGNPTTIASQEGFRKMVWDEQNRLMGINDDGRIHQYTQDYSGERIIKSSGDSKNVSVNGQTAATIVHTDGYVGYVSPYFVIEKGKFTKHFFEGAGRIVSKLGNGTFAQPLGITAGGVNYGKLTAAQQAALDNYVKGLGVPPGPPTQMGIYASPEYTGNPYPTEVVQPKAESDLPPEGWPRYPVFNAPGDVPGPPVQFGPPQKPEDTTANAGFFGIGLPEKDVFYFHPDHLGSTSYITDGNGQISQHVEYLAFGEVLFEEHNSSFKSPYLFNGKELDRETNTTYFGARHQDMKTSLWYGLDKMSENAPNYSGYAYCFNNPMNLVDPDGNWPEPSIPFYSIHLIKIYNAVKDYVSGRSLSGSSSSGGGSGQGGVMLANSKGGSSGQTDLIRKVGRQGSDVEWVDASGLVQAGSFATSLRDGIKYNGSVKMKAKMLKEVNKAYKIGDKLGGKADDILQQFDGNNSENTPQQQDPIDVTVERYLTTDPIRGNSSQTHKIEKDSLVKSESDASAVRSRNSQRRKNAENEAKNKNDAYFKDRSTNN